ncbi:MAG: LacI family DNA-binding transcriptional regulator [Opitutales bacterium]
MPERLKRVTMKAIAERAGVSQATVSLALQGNPRISEATRKQVVRLARRMGYHPDPGITHMNLYRWGRPAATPGSTVAYLTAYGHVRAEHDGFPSVQQACWLGATDEGTRLGYRLYHLDLNQYERPEAVNRLLRSRGVRGLIVGPVRERRWADGLDWDRFPAVAIEEGAIELPIHVINADDFAGARLLCRKLLGRGYRRIGLSIQWDDLIYGYPAERIAGLMHEIQRGDPAFTQVPLLESHFGDVEAVERWIKKHQPDCVVGTNDGFFWNLQMNGHNCPQDFGCAVLIHRPLPRGLIDVSGIDRHARELGVAAMQFLDSRIRLNLTRPKPSEIQKILVPPDWVEGQTLVPLQARRRRRTTPTRKHTRKRSDTKSN